MEIEVYVDGEFIAKAKIPDGSAVGTIKIDHNEDGGIDLNIVYEASNAR